MNKKYGFCDECLILFEHYEGLCNKCNNIIETFENAKERDLEYNKLIKKKIAELKILIR